MIKAIVIGASYGGIEGIKWILEELPPDIDVPMLIVLHIGSNSISGYIAYLNNHTPFFIKEGEEKEMLEKNIVYFAPPNYHLQVENDLTISLSTDGKVKYSRPSIDVLFETASWAYKNQLLGILLTGSNSDGAEGLKCIQDFGGTTIVENPKTAFAPAMPSAAVNLFKPDYVLDQKRIAKKIIKLLNRK